MIRAIRRRLGAQHPEAGLSLIELIVAATMSVVLVGASTAMLISAVKNQPALSHKAENVTTARWQLERIVREIRNGVSVETDQPNELTIVTQVRRQSCGATAAVAPSADAIRCRVTYQCAGSTCMRSEGPLPATEGAPPPPPVGEPSVAISGIKNATKVFCFVPSEEEDPTKCGPPRTTGDPTYVGINLQVENPDASQGAPLLLTISDGATLRTATYSG